MVTTRGQAKKAATEESSIPNLLRGWISLYRAAPRLFIPGTRHTMDITFTLLSAIFLYGIKRIGKGVLVHVFGWPATRVATEAAGSIAAVCHSTLLVPALVACLLTQPYVPSAKMSSAPLWWQQAVTALLQFCTGYMVYDGLVNIVWFNRQDDGSFQLSASDWMFIGHHFATTFYMSSTRILGAGHISALICMCTGEATNPVHNSFMIAQLAKNLDCCNGPFAQKVTFFIEVMFASLYVLFRVVIGPVCMLHITYDLNFTKHGRSNIPVVLRMVFMLMIWGVVLGSVPWIQECIDMLKQHMSGEFVSNPLHSPEL